MARDPSLLTSTAPTAIASASVLIGHVQLRDLIICPRERGVVNYVQHHSIVEHDLNTPDAQPRPLAKLSFLPNTLASLRINGTDDTLLAAGGQDAEIHLSYHSPLSARSRQSGAVWQTEFSMTGSINNSVLLTSMSLTRSNESSVEPRIGISNNDCTVKFYNVPLRGQAKRNLDEVGCLQLNVPINHSSISPDGRTLLSVGDSAKVYLHRMTGGARITFLPLATLKLPPPAASSMNYASTSLTASFSTAFSADGSKFAVASQEGLLAVWDVRSSKPMKVFQTEKSRAPTGNGGASGWLADEIFDWSGGSFKAPGWSVRNVKFGGTGDKEIMTFTEHTSLLHIVDARTFETEEIVRVPSVRERSASAPVQPSQSHRSTHYYRLARPSVVPHNRHTTSASRIDSISPPRTSTGYQSQAHILRALGDTFRIPSPYSPPSSISDSTWRALRMSDPAASTSAIVNPGDSYNDILIIPPFGDPNIESDVQALLGSHGLRTRQQSAAPRAEDDEDDPNTGSAHGDYEYTPRPTYMTVNSGRTRGDDDIEVDELESECASHAPSRSSSPSPSTHAPHIPSPGLGRLGSPVVSAGAAARAGDMQVAYVDDLDIAGTCFDPSGKYIYVASTESVAEWSVRGADKRWWAGSQWM
ncbi:hypothetical protein D9615_009123 [Tricholomella constricta]|uniref:DUF2415 domain-containing protein n=1 Tax=Tricholomella constricta TaxID=117010 RepID=A0A8H5LY88_9AGAR|nr:hypothetical protein D9615_009123 [Tricholomella constricta]